VTDSASVTKVSPHRSVFAKLLAIMLTMAASLLLLVGAFFWFIVNPSLHASIERIIETHAYTIAAQSPTLQAGEQIADDLNIYMSYEGPAGAWSTARFLPSSGEVEPQPRKRSWLQIYRSPRYYVVPAQDGGTYVFAWTIGGSMHRVHQVLLALLLLIMVVVIFTAHAVLKRLLVPLRSLEEGVTRVGEGELDVRIEQRTQDEFGVLTDAFNRMVGRVSETIRARDQLLLDVSHELRSPLTRLKVALELIPASDKRSRMQSDVAEMEAMVTELLELERLREGRGMRFASQDIIEVLREEISRFADRAPGVQIDCDMPSVVLNIDADKVRIVMRNLVENALKYSNSDSQSVNVRVRLDADTLQVQVIDDGHGIPERDIDKLFEPFFRVDRSRSKGTGGYGLGLSICKRIMEAHRGSIAATNNSLSGATFTVRFPFGG
jgi:signal transduction histidine kinase